MAAERLWFFIIEFNYKDEAYYCFWSDDDQGDYLLTKDQQLLFFKSKAEATAFLHDRNDDQPQSPYAKYDLDRVEEFLAAKQPKPDCETLLNFWNMAADGAHLLGEAFVGDNRPSRNEELEEIYDKLFSAITCRRCGELGSCVIPPGAKKKSF